ncbi:MAG: hypothetical protein LQ346_007629 [Caloplaca aetnensis]|nr:MAG: hypothetical protein LQ346_007629 [Caloplaca aetnensis]
MNFTTAALSLPDSEDKQVVDKGLPDLLQAKQVVVPAGLHPVYEEKQCAHLGGDSDKQAAVGESHTSASTSKVPAVRHKKRWLIGNAIIFSAHIIFYAWTIFAASIRYCLAPEQQHAGKRS